MHPNVHTIESCHWGVTMSRRDRRRLFPLVNRTAKTHSTLWLRGEVPRRNPSPKQGLAEYGKSQGGRLITKCDAALVAFPRLYIGQGGSKDCRARLMM